MVSRASGPSPVLGPHPEPVRRSVNRGGWLIGVAVAMAVLLAGTLSQLLISRPDPSDTVAIVEAWSSAQAAHDFDAARQFIEESEWDEQDRNLNSYWAALGAGVVLDDCRAESTTTVSCTLHYRGPHYETFGLPSESVTVRVEEGRIQRLPLMHTMLPADRALADHASSLDPDGLEEACDFTSEDFGLVYTAFPVVYEASCGEFLAGSLDGWLATVDRDR